MATEQMLHAIHECVYGSTVRHVLSLPTEVLIQYLSTFPFYRGADTLYYLLLKREGNNVHYTPSGRHLVAIQPELSGVYTLAEQDSKALVMKDVPGETIYPIIRDHIARVLLCGSYQHRHRIISGEAPIFSAAEVPAIALNFPIYQKQLTTSMNARSVIAAVAHDCWEAFDVMDESLLVGFLDRMASTKTTLPNLWRVVLRNYYEQQLIRLRIHDVLPSLSVQHITMLNAIYPDIVRLPPNLDTIGIRLWYTPKLTRAYLLGFDIVDGIPCDMLISERLQRLRDIGIERYVNEITGIGLDSEGRLTGRIGIMNYPNIIGKRLANTKDLGGILLSGYYPADLYPLISPDDVVIITRNDICSIITGNNNDFDGIRAAFTRETIPYLIEPPSAEMFLDMFTWAKVSINIVRGIPARIKLVELMSSDVLR